MDSNLRLTLKLNYDHQLSPDWHQRGNTFIYGPGSFARDLLRSLATRNVHVLGFIDKRAMGQNQVYGLPVFQPDSAIDCKKTIIILAIHNREANILEIKNSLQRLGYEKILSTINIYDYIAEDLLMFDKIMSAKSAQFQPRIGAFVVTIISQSSIGTRYWLTSRNFYATYLPEIEETYKLLSDDASRTIFEALTNFRINGDFSVLPEPDFHHQYFAPDLPPWQASLRLTDCGAYYGDAITNFIEAGFDFSALAAFEPDPDNYQQLVLFAQKRLNHIKELSLWPCGVHSKSAQVQFVPGQGQASAVSSSGNTIIQCISLDEALPNFGPNLIKMDIEGAELDALKGEHA